MTPSNPVPDQTAPAHHPAGLDALLNAVAAQLPAGDPEQCADTLAQMTTPAERRDFDELSAAVRRMQARHDDQVRAAAFREAADLAHAEGAFLYDDMGQKAAAGYAAGICRTVANGQPAEEPTAEEVRARRDAQDAAATLRQAALLADAEGDSAARDRLRARADEISGKSAPAGGEQA